MIRQNQRLMMLMHALTDGVMIVLAYVVSCWLWLGVYKRDPWNMALHPQALPAACMFAAMMVLLLALSGAYDTASSLRLRQQLPRMWSVSLIGMLAGMAVMYLVRAEDFSRGVLALTYVLSGGCLTAKRLWMRRVQRQLLMKGMHRHQVIVVGTGSLARQYVQNVHAMPQLGIEVIGCLGQPEDALPVPGDLDMLDGMLKAIRTAEVVVALEPAQSGSIRQVIADCERNGAKVSVIPFYNDLIPHSVTIDHIGTSRLINLRANPLDNVGLALIKRCFDIMASLVLLVVLSPLLAGAAIGVRLSGPGPILYRQIRVGKHKTPFTMYKFRSMQVNDDGDSAWTTNDDRRKTRFGAWMRRYSIDELPQLLNVLKGEMSLVGPRPEIPFYVEQFKDSVPLYMVKHQVRPGMTGWAQVNGWRGDTSIVRRIEHDVWYIENWSIRLDLLILLKTAMGGFMNREQPAQTGRKA